MKGLNLGLGLSRPLLELPIVINDYASWATTGTATAILNFSGICELNATDVVVVESAITDQIRIMRWNGSTFVQQGATFTGINFGSGTHCAKLDSTHFVVADHNNNLIRAFNFDGSTITAVGNNFTQSMGNYSDITWLADGVIGFWAQGVGGGLIKFTWDGTDFTQVGNQFSLTGDYKGLMGLDATTMAVHATNTDDLITYVHDGTDWAAVGSAFSIGAITGSYTGTALTSSQVLIWSNGTTGVQTLRWSGSSWSTEHVTSALTGPSSWPRSMAVLTPTLIAYHSFGDADIRAAVATLD